MPAIKVDASSLREIAGRVNQISAHVAHQNEPLVNAMRTAERGFPESASLGATGRELRASVSTLAENFAKLATALSTTADVYQATDRGVGGNFGR